jgi:hypothetical protein
MIRNVLSLLTLHPAAVGAFPAICLNTLHMNAIAERLLINSAPARMVIALVIIITTRVAAVAATACRQQMTLLPQVATMPRT